MLLEAINSAYAHKYITLICIGTNNMVCALYGLSIISIYNILVYILHILNILAIRLRCRLSL